MSRGLGRRALLGGLAGAVAASAAGAAGLHGSAGSGARAFPVGVTGGAIDAGPAGPAPVVIHHARHTRHGRGGLRIVAGCCSGGASLVVGRTSGIARPSDLHGKRIAVTQIGTTQDVALRMFLRDAGLRETTSGGDVTVLAISGATILEQMKRGELHGAWLPEPWATRVVADLSAIRLVDERDLWPDKRFSTAVLVTRAEDAAAPFVLRLASALEDEVTRALADPRATLAEAHAELARHVAASRGVGPPRPAMGLFA